MKVNNLSLLPNLGNSITQISQHCPFGLLSLNAEYIITEANEAFCELLGTPLEQIQNKSLWQLFPDWPCRQISQTIDKKRAYTGNQMPVDRLTLRHWQKRHWNINIWPVAGTTGSAILSATDVTEEVENSWQKEDMMATLAHDLKVPLTGADRMLELLLEDLPPNAVSNQQMLLSQLKASNQEALHLIYNVLSLYSSGQNRQTFRNTNVDLVDTSRQILSELKVFAQSKKISLRLNHPPSPVIIVGDLLSLRRLIINLVHNAIKFSFNESTVEVTVGDDQRTAILCVTDKGPGISAEDQKHLFQRFCQARQTTPEFTGSGLGLYVCHNIVQAHEGKISCVSSLGIGSTFTVRLPLDPMDSL